MTTQNLTLFKALNAKMHYLNQRQRLISQNVANADTPSYKPQDLKPVDFGVMVKRITKGDGISMQPTKAGHMPKPDQVFDPDVRNQKITYEVAPAGNAVIIEEQLIQSNGNIADYNLMTNLYQKNVRMLQTALGRN